MELSPYKITWIRIMPVDGRIITKHDRRQFGEKDTLGDRKIKFLQFGSKDNALKFIKTFNKKLDKKYECILFTDRQFKLSVYLGKDMFSIPFTKKQIKDKFII